MALLSTCDKEYECPRSYFPFLCIILGFIHSLTVFHWVDLKVASESIKTMYNKKHPAIKMAIRE